MSYKKENGRSDNHLSARFIMAGATGLEPATSGVTGRRSNQLNYAPELSKLMGMVGGTGLEPVTLGL